MGSSLSIQLQLLLTDSRVPELPEVETVRCDLESYLPGETIAWISVLRDQTVAHPDPDTFSHCLVGCQFESWHRRGKYLLGRFTNGMQLVIHLRMTGQLLWLDPEDTPLDPHTRLRFGMAGGWELRFVDQRTFGQVWAISATEAVETVVPTVARLGPEPLSTDFTTETLKQSLRRSQRPIKTALLDQSLVAGIGNIYADESLFLSGIHPRSPCHTLSHQQVESLRQRVVQVLTESLQQRGTTLRNYRDTQGLNGNYQGQAWVYGRDEEPCRNCQTPIERIKLAGRSAHFCPHCQTL